METSDRKVRKLMEEYEKTGNLSRSALRADMDRKTARKYIACGQMPSELREPRTWRTREDPFAEHWSACRSMFEDCPELEAKTVFEWLCRQDPGRYQEGQLRTFQRRVRAWRATAGPDKEVFFAQKHEPGRRLSTDFTHMKELGVTIRGELFDYLLCHSALTFSNWEWAAICHSESMVALRTGIQETLTHLGHVPEEHWTDHSSAATHELGEQSPGKRGYNAAYLDLMAHFGMTPRTIQVDSPHENGDIESLNGALKRRLAQHLLLRGSRDFASQEAYREFLHGVLRQVNGTRQDKLSEELAQMRVLDVDLLPDYSVLRCQVRSWSTINVKRRIYSVPSRLIGSTVTVHRYAEHIEVFYQGERQLTAPWLRKERSHHINYRHVIESLVRKPGAFPAYRFRADLFPTAAFRWACDRLHRDLIAGVADREYLQILKHAATTMECEVDRALRRLWAEGKTPRLDVVLAVCPRPVPVLPVQAPLTVELHQYDQLLSLQEVCR
ncbi:MAG: IS21 family transposase [Spirochaetaceae bacterium]|nr:MAG: IS21 family transposase [Spirochaetaceae bacterium]